MAKTCHIQVKYTIIWQGKCDKICEILKVSK